MISASQAFLASATVPELYVTSITAIGDSMDLSANESINLIVGGIKVGGRNYMRYSRDMVQGDNFGFLYEDGDPICDDFLVGEAIVD